MTNFPSNYQPSVFDRLMSKNTINFEEFSIAPPDENSLLEDLQANILKHHRKNFACHVFIKFKKKTDPAIVSDWISNLNITTALEQLSARKKKKYLPLIQCFYLSSAGYQFLEIAHLAPRNCPSFFKGPRQEIMESFHQRIEKPFAKMGNDSDPIHAMLLLASNSAANLTKEVQKIEKELKTIANIDLEYGLLKKETKGAAKGKFVEWFGFADEVSTSKFFPNKMKDAQTIPNTPKLRSILTRDPGGHYAQSGGSFLVFMKFEQDPSAFEKLQEKISEKIKLPDKKVGDNYVADLSEAYILGRFKDGTPLTLKDKKGEMDPSRMNHFDYDEISNENTDAFKTDAHGPRCPHFAHARKSNPRKDKNEYSERTIHRRGMLYVDEKITTRKLNELHSKSRTTILEKGKEVGMYFMGFQNQIEKQFEYITTRWMHRSEYIKSDEQSGMDILTAKASKEKLVMPTTWNGDEKTSIIKGKTLVKLKGACYLFSPSISFLKHIDEEYAKAKELTIQKNIKAQKNPKAVSKKKRAKKMKPDRDSVSGGVKIKRKLRNKK